MSTSRLEKFVYAICSMEVSDLPAPLSRIEILWNCLITGETPDFEPQSRNEQYLMAMLGLYELENLPTPMSRGEKLLYKIAMGETDLSDVPAYLSRYEELLGYLAENGGVGDFEYILQTLNQRLSTLYSTKERPMKQAVIKGDTLVNELPRPSLKNTMTNVGIQKLNQGYDSINPVDGEFKSAILKGQTLVNIVNFEKSYFRTTGTINSRQGCTINFSTATTGKFNLGGKISLLKTDTKYLLKVKLEWENKATTYVYLLDEDNNKYIMSNTSIKDNNYSYKFTTPSTLGNTIKLGFIRTADGGEETITASVLLIEHQEGMENWDIPYFTGMQSVKMPVLTTNGKNLFDGKLELGGYTGTTGEPYNANDRVRSINKTYLKPGVYYLSSDNATTVAFGIFNIDGTFREEQARTSGNTLKLVLKQEAYVRITVVNSDLLNAKIQLEEGSTATPYEPYKSNILTVKEEVVLRSLPNGVCDTLNVETGELTQRIGEIVFDGSEDWTLQAQNDWQRYVITIEDMINIYDFKNPNRTRCDKLVYDVLDTKNSGSYLRIHNKIAIYNNEIVKDVEQFKQWLSQNPITIQYELATESIKTVDLTTVDQDGVTQSKLHSFNDGHLSVSSQGLLPSAVDYEVPTNNSYYLPDMLTLGAQYTSRGSADCNATIDGKLLALGKNRTFTTPSSVTNRLMVLDTAVDDLMFIKGDQTTKDFGYFEGMKSVVLSNKMPVLTTTGKNLFDGILKQGYLGDSSGMPNTASSGVHSPNYIRVNPLTTYICSWKTKPSSSVFKAYFYGENKEFLKQTKQSNSFTTPDGCYYVRFRFFGGSPTPSDFENIQLEEGTVSTPYEPFKSNILTVNEPVELRGIGDVKDELNCLTGEVTERIKTTTLDKFSNWNVHPNVSEGFSHFAVNITDISKIPHVLICDSFPAGNISGVYNGTSEGLYHSGNKYIHLTIKTDKLSENNVNGLKQYLKNNIITIQYPLNKKSVKTVDLTTVDQDGQPTKLKTFNDITYVEINADNIIPSVDVEVATKISETLSTLGLDHHDISETQDQLGQTIDEQTENTDATMMATTEIYENL